MSKAREVFPYITVSPDVSFGRPCLRGRGLRADIVFDHFMAGETVSEIAYDFMVSELEIQSAIRWHCLDRRKRKRLLEGK